jgi:flagellar biogenesis protein FliO
MGQYNTVQPQQRLDQPEPTTSRSTADVYRDSQIRRAPQLVATPHSQQAIQDSQPGTHRNETAFGSPSMDPNASQVRQANWSSPNAVSSTDIESSSFKPASNARSIPLEPPSDKSEQASRRSSGWFGNLVSMMFSLLFVVGVFLFLVWGFRKTGLPAMVSLPDSVVQVLGQRNLSPRQPMYVVRFGSKLILVSQQAGQTQTLSEIVDPDEVERLVQLCESSSSRGTAKSFRQVVQDFASRSKESQSSGLRVNRTGVPKGFSTKG